MTIKHWMKRGVTAVLAVLVALATAQTHADETITYIHWDALGSPVAATDESGNVVWRESYRPYGERIDHEAAADDHSRWYTGHPQDADTGFVYAGARYYDPVIGRFLAIDPVGVQEDNLHSFNRYAYANNNPYGYIDPDGREGVGPAFVMQDHDRFTGAFGTSGSVEQGTQQVVTILETADTVSSVFMPVKGAVVFVGKQAAKGVVTRGVKALAPPSGVPNAGGRIVSDVTKAEQTFFRVSSSADGPGRFLTRVPPANRGQAIEGLALPPGNTAEFIQRVTVPAGTRLQRSRALPAFGRRGGREQFELIDRIPDESFGTGVPFR